jgi:molybdopterin-containing oxidoreductase family iron-sulfur binding subunit
LARAFATAKASAALAGPVASTGHGSRMTAMAAGLLNYACGRIGQTVDFYQPHALSRSVTRESLRTFLMQLTETDVLILANCNPVYAWPSCRHELRRAGKIIYLGCSADETSQIADWVLPVNSPLESWGDYEPYENVNGLMQPTMSPMYDTRSTGDVLLALAQSAGMNFPLRKTNQPAESFHQWLRNRWDELARRCGKDAESFWQESLKAGGIVAGSGPANPPVKLATKSLDFRQATELATAPATAPAEGAELWLYANSLLHDGRVGNRGWIQEIPDPISQIVWGNWIDIHPDKARQLGVRDFDVLQVQGQEGKLELPVRLTTQVHPECLAVMLGHGHQAVGMPTAQRGANGFELIGGSRPQWAFGRVAVRKTLQRSEWIALAPTQEQFGRKLLQWDELEEVKNRSEGEEIRLPLPEGYDPARDLYPKRNYKKHRWAMVIDLEKCVGCGACIAACYAENNVGVVGWVNCRDGREMAWLKVVPYRRDEVSPPHGGGIQRVGFLPLPCQHCDTAPCEPVCPVFAAVHNEEGLNAQIYNRCIGTRYCANNCPYKVRRFNWFDTGWKHPLDWQLNPDVSVRCRGVMEKCTFCVQRIHRVERQARLEGRAVRDGEVVPACVQTCPSGVCTFGDLLDPESTVSKLTREDVRRYQVLGELNTKPAVTYLRKVIIEKPGQDHT